MIDKLIDPLDDFVGVGVDEDDEVDVKDSDIVVDEVCDDETVLEDVDVSLCVSV